MPTEATLHGGMSFTTSTEAYGDLSAGPTSVYIEGGSIGGGDSGGEETQAEFYANRPLGAALSVAHEAGLTYFLLLLKDHVTWTISTMGDFHDYLGTGVYAPEALEIIDRGTADIAAFAGEVVDEALLDEGYAWISPPAGTAVQNGNLMISTALTLYGANIFSEISEDAGWTWRTFNLYQWGAVLDTGAGVDVAHGAGGSWEANITGGGFYDDISASERTADGFIADLSMRSLRTPSAAALYVTGSDVGVYFETIEEEKFKIFPILSCF